MKKKETIIFRIPFYGWDTVKFEKEKGCFGGGNLIISMDNARKLVKIINDSIKRVQSLGKKKLKRHYSKCIKK